MRTVEVTEERLTANLDDGRIISVPLAWSRGLSDATPQQRQRWQIIGDGADIRWPDVDEDISVRWMLEGIPAPRRVGRQEH